MADTIIREYLPEEPDQPAWVAVLSLLGWVAGGVVLAIITL